MRGGRSGSPVVQPRYRHHCVTPTRCDPMIAAPSRDWSVFKQICVDHWEAFPHAHLRSRTAYYEGLVTKMLGGGHPDKMGDLEYRCLPCGQGTPRGAMSCKSSLWLRWAKVSVDHWVSQVSKVLYEGVLYRP